MPISTLLKFLNRGILVVGTPVLLPAILITGWTQCGFSKEKWKKYNHRSTEALKYMWYN